MRFSISMPAEVRDRVKAHAAAVGLDVSAFLTIAAVSQMDEEDRARAVLGPFVQARAEAEAIAAEGTADTWTDELVLTPEEQAEVDAILRRLPRGEAAA